MSEYRRFIAYFYEYIDGKKQKNAGFAKVELRNGMWRILFRLNTETEPLRPVRAYGFVREQGWQLGLYMGSMRPGVVRMEEWAYRADIPVWQGKYGFASLAGIWIQSEDGRRYVTVWDDEPVFTDRFVLALPKEAVNTENKEEKSEQVTERETESIHEKQTEENSDEKNETERQIHAAEISEAWEEEKKKYSGVDEDQAETVDVEDTDNCEEQAEAMPEEHISEEEAAAEVCEAFEDEMISEEVPVQEEPHACRSSGQEQVLAMLFASRPVLEPFPDTEFLECVQLRPCDLVRLQQANCRVGRNTFLQHGLYQYHHLLLAKDQEGHYILGVPGVVNAQERYMAGMFAFDRFKPANGYDRGWQFGYWCREIWPGQQAHE